MHKRLFLLMGVIVTMAIVSIAQTNDFQRPRAVNIISSSVGSDPLGILESEDGTAAAVKAVVVVNTAGFERVAFDLVNMKRVQNGLQPLEWSDKIAAVARLHSQNMAEFHFFSHRGLDNKMVSDRADAEKLGKWQSIGENIAYNRGYKDPIAKAVELWLNSPSHLHNMLDGNWKESAIGVAVAMDGSYYFTQVFLKK